VARVEESHKGHDIVIEEPEGARGGGERRALAQAAQEEPRLSIDGRPVRVIQNPDGTYSSVGVFYTSYPSLSELARASIDIHLPEA
jgi:Tyrosinase co-factor MelC1